MAGRLPLLHQQPGRTARDLAVNPARTISVRLPGIDLVLAGNAARVNIPTAGPQPWHVYRFTFRTVVGVATAEPYRATRWRFQS